MNIAFLNNTDIDEHLSYARAWCQVLDKSLLELPFGNPIDEDYCEHNDIDMLVFSCHNDRRELRKVLLRCRDLRIPYLILTNSMSSVGLPKCLLLPVSMLEEEVYKAQIAAHIARHTNARVIILTANDYGSRARVNSQKILTHLESMNVESESIVALKDSFHLHNETADRQHSLHSELTIWTASREYGLDDIVFGPAELSLIRHSVVPLMLINPRDDLFSLCD